VYLKINICDYIPNTTKMSTGGMFQLVSNDGIQDKMLNATELLNERIKKIHEIRKNDPSISDPTPTLVDIERTHIIFMNAHFKPFVATAYEYMKVGVQEGGDLGQQATFSIPQYGDFFHDMVVHIQLTGLTTGPVSTKVRYCEFLGHRILQQTRFEVNGLFLDEYSSDVYNFEYNSLPEQKRRAWKQNVGQEISHPAYLTQDPVNDNYREVKQIVDGPQTPKALHQVVDLWIPLLFWFNKDPKLMIPSVAIPYGMRFIRMVLAPATAICQGLPTPDFTEPTVSAMELYVQHVFVNPEIHDIFIQRIGFSLVRVHREAKISVNEPSGLERVDQFRFPVEYFYVGLRPNINDGSMENWHRYHFVTDNLITFPVAVPNPLPPPPTHIIAFGNAIYKTSTPTIDNLLISSKGVELYHTTPMDFFSHYLHYKLGDYNIGSAEDDGIALIPFCLYPGMYQPNGHLNISRSRDFYVQYNSSVISPVIPGTLVLYSVAINFILIQDGYCLLRYAT
jgi:hypothetical protein